MPSCNGGTGKLISIRRAATSTMTERRRYILWFRVKYFAQIRARTCVPFRYTEPIALVFDVRQRPRVNGTQAAAQRELHTILFTAERSSFIRWFTRRCMERRQRQQCGGNQAHARYDSLNRIHRLENWFIQSQRPAMNVVQHATSNEHFCIRIRCCRCMCVPWSSGFVQFIFSSGTRNGTTSVGHQQCMHQHDKLNEAGAIRFVKFSIHSMRVNSASVSFQRVGMSTTRHDTTRSIAYGNGRSFSAASAVSHTNWTTSHSNELIVTAVQNWTKPLPQAIHSLMRSHSGRTWELGNVVWTLYSVFCDDRTRLILLHRSIH